MGAICEKIENAIERINDGIDRLAEYQDELTNTDLNKMAALALTLHSLVTNTILTQSKDDE